MTVLNNIERVSVWTYIMRNIRDFLGAGENASALKNEYRQLVDDLDDWLDANAASANTAIRAGIRNKFTAAEKNRALSLVAAKRGGLPRVGGFE